MSALFDPIFGVTAVATATGDEAWLTALCEAENALARAGERVGLVDATTAGHIATACDELSRSDPAELGRRSVAGGNPVIPLVAGLRERVERLGGAAAGVHLGATSQDILDTAMMLVTRRALDVVLADLRADADAAAALARIHRLTPMAARTLLQQALPTTFGALCAVWGAGLDHAVATLTATRSALPAQLGGAAGTLADLQPHGPAVQSAFADELGLVEPAGVWHAERSVITGLAGALGGAAAAVAKVAGDIVLLSQTELGEVHESAPGGSSAMAHKQNPIAAITARAAAAQAPGLVATLLTSAAPELQRGAGAWHAEWPALTALLHATGGSAARLRASFDGLHVDAPAMARNLALLDGIVESTRDVGQAGDLVDRYLDRRRP